MKMRMLCAALCAMGLAGAASASAQPTGTALHANDTSVGVVTTAYSADGKAQIGTFHIDHFEKRGLDLYVVGWFTGGPDEVLVADSSMGTAKKVSNGTQSTMKRYTFRRIADPGVVIALPVDMGSASCDSMGMTFGPLEVASIHDKSFLRVKEPKTDPKWSQTMFSVNLTPTSVKSTDARSSFCNVAGMVNGGANRSSLVDHLNMLIGVRNAMGAR